LTGRACVRREDFSVLLYHDACGAISGFHSLISSGTTPKMIQREGHARLIGYGAMLLESFVGVMAMGGCVRDAAGVYFAINSPAGVVGTAPDAVAATDFRLGLFISTRRPMVQHGARGGRADLFQSSWWSTIFGGGHGADFFQHDRRRAVDEHLVSLRVMFEALFILTVLDAGTRVGRFMVQEMGGRVWKPFGQTSWMPSVVISSAWWCVLGGIFCIKA